MDRHRYRRIMTFLCMGLLTAVISCARAEIRLIRAGDPVRENTEEPEHAAVPEYAAVGKALGETVYTAARAAYIPQVRQIKEGGIQNAHRGNHGEIPVL